MWHNAQLCETSIKELNFALVNDAQKPKHVEDFLQRHMVILIFTSVVEWIRLWPTNDLWFFTEGWDLITHGTLKYVVGLFNWEIKVALVPPS